MAYYWSNLPKLVIGRVRSGMKFSVIHKMEILSYLHEPVPRYSVSNGPVPKVSIESPIRTTDYASGTTTQKSSNIGPFRMPQFY